MKPSRVDTDEEGSSDTEEAEDAPAVAPVAPSPPAVPKSMERDEPEVGPTASSAPPYPVEQPFVHTPGMAWCPCHGGDPFAKGGGFSFNPMQKAPKAMLACPSVGPPVPRLQPPQLAP